MTVSTGWNMFAIITDYTNDGTDRNITVSDGFNLIGYSSNTTLNLSEVKFTDATGTYYSSWQEAINAGKVQAYLTYREDNKYKYIGTPDTQMHDYALRPGKAYWLHAHEPGTITFPAIGGSPTTGQTFEFNNLQAYKDGTLADITAIGTNYNWLFIEENENLYYKDGSGFDLVYGGCIPPNCKTTTSPWEGYFVYGNTQNVTLLFNQ